MHVIELLQQSVERFTRYRSAPRSAWILAVTPSLFVVLTTRLNVSIYANVSGIPVSDASGWFSCVKTLAFFNQWDSANYEWCNRRSYYPLIASFFYRILGNLDFYFILFSILFSICVFWLQIELRRFVRDWMRIAFTVVVILVWGLLGAIQVLTEQIGILLATLSCCLLLQFLRTHSQKSFYAFAISLVIAQQIRPGNSVMLLLPFFLVLLYDKIARWRILLKLGLFIYIPLFTLPLTIRLIFGPIFFMHGANKWSTIYGLQFGNIGWNEAYSVIPHSIQSDVAQGQFLKQLVLANVSEHPFAIMNSILSNLAHVVAKVVPGSFPLSIVIVCILVGVVLVSLRKFIQINRAYWHVALFLVVVIAFEFIYAAIFLRSEFTRTLSTTYLVSGLLSVLILSRYKFEIRADRYLSHRGPLKLTRKPILFVIVSLITIGILYFEAPFLKVQQVPSFELAQDKCAAQLIFEAKGSSLVQFERVNSSRDIPPIVGSFDEMRSQNIFLFSVTAVNEGGVPRTFNFYTDKWDRLRENKLVSACIGYQPRIDDFPFAVIS